MSQAALRVRVRGRVQGVFFRAWTRQQAELLGVAGWVRNAFDGSVEAHLEGEQSAVQQLVQRLHRGPASAKVSEVEAEAANPEGAPNFEIRN